MENATSIDAILAAAPTGDPTVEAIHIAKGRRLPMQSKDSVAVETAKGIVGDRYHGARHRQVTVQSRESLDEAAATYGREIPSHLTRRNITVSHGVIPREPGTRLRIGEVLLEAVRVAAPCKLLDDTIGPGAQEALRRRAGTVFRVLEGGTIELGDELRPG